MYAAEADLIKKDPEIFVSTLKGRQIENPVNRLIFGRKGSGKTALDIDFRRNSGSGYKYILQIDANDPSFGRILKSCSNLNSDEYTTSELFRTVTNLWEFSILANIMNNICKNENKLKCREIYDYLERYNILDKPVYRLLRESYEKVEKIFSDKYRMSPKEIDDIVDGYPVCDIDFMDARRALAKYLSDNDTKILVTFDRIDTYTQIPKKLRKQFYSLDKLEYRKFDIVEHRALRLFLAGLVQGVYNITVDETGIGKQIDFKVFLPVDKKDSVRTRDWDKIKQFVFDIEWSKDELKEFISRRISKSLDIRDASGNLETNIDKTWLKLFPKRLINTNVAGIPEQIEEFFLRNSFYKPRDLQIYCVEAKKLAEAKGIEDALDELSVREIIQKVKDELVDNFFLEFEYDYPFIGVLIDHFRGRKNIMQLEIFLEIINQFLKKIEKKSIYSDYISQDELIAILYNIAFVGGVITGNPQTNLPIIVRRVKQTNYNFYFSYIDPNFDIKLSSRIVIHPIFDEYLNLIIDKDIIIG